MSDKFPTLRTIASFLKVLAWIVAITCLLGFISAVGYAIVKSAWEAIVLGVILLIYATYVFIHLYLTGELIYVAIDIEANTRQANEYLAYLAQAARTTQQPPTELG